MTAAKSLHLNQRPERSDGCVAFFHKPIREKPDQHLFQHPAPCPHFRRKRRQAGSAVVEFGLVLIPLLVLLFLLLDLGWIFFGWASLQEGVREGVRYGVTGQLLAPNTGLNSSITQVVKDYSFGFLNAGNSPVVTIQYYSPTNMQSLSGTGATNGGNVINVSATITLKSLVPMWRSNGKVMGTFAAWPITLTASSSDVMEGSPGGVAPPEYP